MACQSEILADVMVTSKPINPCIKISMIHFGEIPVFKTMQIIKQNIILDFECSYSFPKMETIWQTQQTLWVILNQWLNLPLWHKVYFIHCILDLYIFYMNINCLVSHVYFSTPKYTKSFHDKKNIIYTDYILIVYIL